MASNQQQTDLPQETSPHHVYGNQHFSRDLLIAAQGAGGGEGSRQTIGFSLIFCRENSDVVSTAGPSRILFTGFLPNGTRNNAAAQGLISPKTIGMKGLFTENGDLLMFPTQFCVTFLQFST